jgi:tryptophan synthase alpha chain
VTLDEAFAAVRGGEGALLLPYLMAGLPSVDESVALFEAAAEAGADGFEIGIPYADPLMDGAVIQEAGRRALEAGTTMADGIEVARRVRESTAKPCLVMTYVNPVLRLGAAEFGKRMADAGVEAVILADLPVDESEAIAHPLAEAGVGLVQFAAPTTSDDRLRRIAAARPPFVYCVAEMGVTGERRESGGRAAGLVERVRAATDAPAVIGVGISTADAAGAAARIADGVIVGSALVRRVLEADDAAAGREAVADAVGEMARAVHDA